MNNPTRPKPAPPGASRRIVPPEIVREISERVYDRLLEDLQVERERRRGLPTRRTPRRR